MNSKLEIRKSKLCCCTRDLLLPKLISGEIRLENVEVRSVPLRPDGTRVHSGMGRESLREMSNGKKE
ncbi:MAG: hypothetical protein ABIK27_04200 [Bacteroidota bacterium]